MPSRAKPWIVFLIAAVVLAPSFIAAVEALDLAHLGWFHDDAMYWLLAKSLGSGTGYRMIGAPGTPHMTILPPAYPFLLSIAWRVASSPHAAGAFAVWINWSMLVILIWLTDRLALAMNAGVAPRLFLCLWIAWNPVVVSYSVSLMSEMMFACEVVACILLLQRALQGEAPLRFAAYAGVLGGLAYLTRSAGLVLLPVALLCLLVRKQYPGAAAFVVTFIPSFVAWWLRTRSLVRSGDWYGFPSYFAHYDQIDAQDIPRIVSLNIRLLGARLAELPFYSLDTVSTLASWALMACVIGAVFYWLFRAAAPQMVPAIFSILYLGMLIVWPDVPNSRLLVPLMPAIGSLFMSTLSLSSARQFSIALIAIPLGAYGLWTAGVASFVVVPARMSNEKSAWESTTPIYAWLRDHSSESVVVTQSAAVTYLRSGVPSIEAIVPVLDWYLPPGKFQGRQNRHLMELAGKNSGFLLLTCPPDPPFGEVATSVVPCSMPPDLWRQVNPELVMKSGAGSLYRLGNSKQH